MQSSDDDKPRSTAPQQPFVIDHGMIVKLSMTASAAFLMTWVVLYGQEIQMHVRDVLVYSSIYCFWVVFVLPEILIGLNFAVMSKVCVTLIRLFAAEIAVAAWAFLRGEKDVFVKTLHYRRAIEHGLQWLPEFLASFRLALIIGIVCVGIVSRVFKTKPTFTQPVVATRVTDRGEDAERNTP